MLYCRIFLFIYFLIPLYLRVPGMKKKHSVFEQTLFGEVDASISTPNRYHGVIAKHRVENMREV